MTVEEQIENLKRIGALKDAIRDESAIRQYLANARQYRDDATKAETSLGRFTLAYEALHALAMAFLTDRSVRTGGEGHRTTALQLSVVELTKGSIKGAAQAIIQIHAARNDSTYFNPIPPVSAALAKATLKLLDAALVGAGLPSSWRARRNQTTAFLRPEAALCRLLFPGIDSLAVSVCAAHPRDIIRASSFEV